MTVYNGCGQDYNSNSGDALLASGSKGLDCSTPEGARLCTAMEVLTAYNCYQCHAPYAAYKSDQAWKNSGLVVPGDPAASQIVSRLINAGSNMPLGGAALAADDYAALQDWIQNMQ